MRTRENRPIVNSLKPSPPTGERIYSPPISGKPEAASAEARLLSAGRTGGSRVPVRVRAHRDRAGLIHAERPLADGDGQPVEVGHHLAAAGSAAASGIIGCPAGVDALAGAAIDGNLDVRGCVRRFGCEVDRASRSSTSASPVGSGLSVVAGQR